MIIEHLHNIDQESGVGFEGYFVTPRMVITYILNSNYITWLETKVLYLQNSSKGVKIYIIGSLLHVLMHKH